MANKTSDPTGEVAKLCFVVCPIGSPGSAERKRSNGFLREVIAPIAQEFGYLVERADHDKGPGIVTEAIINKLISAYLVVADLHGPNPNVMYEVAIRHATGRPIIQMMPDGEALPFDIGGLNTIQYDPDVDGLARWRQDLREAMKAVEEGRVGENPVSRAGLYRALESRDAVEPEVMTAEVLRHLASIERFLLDQRMVLTTSPSQAERLRDEVRADWYAEFYQRLRASLGDAIPNGTVILRYSQDKKKVTVEVRAIDGASGIEYSTHSAQISLEHIESLDMDEHVRSVESAYEFTRGLRPPESTDDRTEP